MSYVGNKPGSYNRIEASQYRATLTATAGQTNFVTNGYNASNLKVFLNGVLLDTSDYTAPDGVNIILGVGAALNDELTFISEAAFSTTVDTISCYTMNMLGTTAMQLPVGTTAQRPGSPYQGMFRFNSTEYRFEDYNGVSWSPMTGATGAGGNRAFFENDANVTASYTIGTGKNAMSAGPITVADSIEVVVPDGSEWTIV